MPEAERDNDDTFSLVLRGEVETYGQIFKVRLSGVSHANEDGSGRQELLSRCRPGEPVVLRREPINPYDRWAIAVHRTSGEKLGYVPAGDRRLAEHIDPGGAISARIVEVDGGPTVLDRLFRRNGKSYGCVIEVEKGDFDWKAMRPYIDLDRAAAKLVKDAEHLEKVNAGKALQLYNQAIARIAELDQHGQRAQAWRTTRHPINRVSLLLEQKGENLAAVETIEAYLATADPIGLSRSDLEAVTKRRARLQSRRR